MNDLMRPLFWSVLQVSFLASAGLVLSALIARRAAAAAALLITMTLAFCCALTMLAFSPLPDWWTWNATEPAALPASAEPTVAPESATPLPNENGSRPPQEVRGFAPSGLDLHWLRRRWPEASFPETRRGQRWPGIVVWVILAGALWGVGRLGLGLWAVRRLAQNSRRITDRSLLDLAAQLRATMGVARFVELRDSAELTSAATIGWPRSLILLPRDWLTWTESERRAVLAHELAHVGRRDYLAWLLARLSLALHFYHPLVIWLVRRLHLQQELAADALGVRFGGGRSVYLRVLAQMALRQDDQLRGGPVPSFLSSPGTLLRRISMLKARDGVHSESAPRGVRAAGWVLLALAALMASALRSPAQRQAQSSSEIESASLDEAKKPEVPPFDLSYLAPDAMGALAVRPAAVFSRPEMKKYREQVNTTLVALYANLAQGNGKLDLRLEDIEQIVCSVRFATDKNADPKKGGQTSVMTHLHLVRTVRDHDWKKTLSVFNVKEIKIEGQTCYVAPKGSLPMLGTLDVCFCVPDKRTVVMDSEDAIRALLQSKKEKRPTPSWMEDWKQVERGIFAQAITDIRTVMADRKPVLDDSDPSMVLLRTSRSLVFGFDLGEEIRFQLLVRADTEKDAEKSLQTTRDLMKGMKKGLLDDKKGEKKPASKEQEAAWRAFDEMVTKYELKRSGTRIHLQTGAKVANLVDFAELLFAASTGEMGAP